MFWKLGWILDSLQYRVNKDLKETVFQNETFLEYQWGFVRRLIVATSKHFLLANVVLVFAAITFSYLVTVNYEIIIRALPKTVNGTQLLIDLSPTILSTQVTILGLVFPLVIAFIGFLLQGKSSNESMWIIYKHNSGLMVVGFSSLSLSLFLLLFQLTSLWLPHASVVALSIFVIIWLCLNLLLVAWFLWVTIEFLSKDKRMVMVVKYAVNEIIISDIKNRLLFHHSSAAEQTGALPKQEENGCIVSTYSVKKLPYTFSKSTSSPIRITNVYYRIVRFSIWLWKVKLKFGSKAEGESYFCFPVIFDTYLKKELVIAKSNSNKFNKFEELVLNLSISFRSSKVEKSLELDEVVGAIYSEIEDALKDNNSREFDSAQRELIKFYKVIESSMLFINDNGKPDNWIFLSKGGWSSDTFLNAFLKEAHSISKTLTRRIYTDPNYYETWCYFFAKLMPKDKNARPVSLLKEYISGQYHLWAQLMHFLGNKNTLGSDQSLDRTIKHFVGSWEHWHYLINREYSGTHNLDFDLALQHLDKTSWLIISATKHNNWTAANWAVDTLIYWFDLFSDNRQWYKYYGWHHELLTFEVLESDKTSNIFKSVYESEPYEDSFAKESATIALRNAWTDTRVLTAAYLLGSSNYNENEYFKKLVKAIVHEEWLEPTGDIAHSFSQIKNIQDLMNAYLRMFGFWETQYEYKTGIEQKLEALSRIEEPDWVSGRIYSSHGTKAHLYLPAFFKLFGIGFSHAVFSLNNDWLSFLKSDCITQQDLENTISAIENLGIIEDELLTTVSFIFDIDLEKVNVMKSNFEESIKSIAKDLKSEILIQITQAEIDEDRLINFGDAATGISFNIIHGPIPICLFKDIDYVDELDNKSTITYINKYHKSEVSIGLEVNRAANENEWLSNIIEQRVVGEAFNQFIQKVTWIEASFSNSLELLTKAVEDGKNLILSGVKPILFIGPWSIYRLIDSSRWKYAEEDQKLPFTIEVETDKEESYVCHIDGIEIHRSPFDKATSTYLISKGAFDKLIVKRFGDGRYVDVQFQTVNPEDTLGDLILEFGINCIIAKSRAYRYISKDED